MSIEEAVDWVWHYAANFRCSQWTALEFYLKCGKIPAELENGVRNALRAEVHR